MAHDDAFPDLVYTRQHGVGLHDEHSFEDTLRELMRSSPYLGISVLIHAGVLAIFAFMSSGAVQLENELRIEATPEVIEEPLPPPPPPEEKIEEIEEIIEEPVVSEDVIEEVTEIIDFVSADANFDSSNLNDVIGVGGGGGGNFGKVGRRGSKGTAAGKPQLEAVDLGLKWLKFHQMPDGFWSGAAFDEMCGGLGDDTICDGTGSPLYDVGLTGMALLAYLGAGESPKKGKYKDTVKKGLKFLSDVQQSNGNFGNEQTLNYTYDHIIATLAMCEAYALTELGYLKKPANKALKYMYSIRNSGGAWRYAPEHPEMLLNPDDTSVTGWAIMAMTLAKEYDLEFDEQALEDAYAFMDAMTDPVTGRTGYTEAGNSPPREAEKEADWPPQQTESLTAVGILCRIFVDPDLKRPGNLDMCKRGVQLIERLPPLFDPDQPGRVDYYYWYYASYALFQYQEVDAKPWKNWEKTLVSAIANQQHKEGERTGSWDPQDDPWGHEGGRIYTTAINILTMEVYYRYDTVMGSH